MIRIWWFYGQSLVREKMKLWKNLLIWTKSMRARIRSGTLAAAAVPPWSSPFACPVLFCFPEFLSPYLVRCWLVSSSIFAAGWSSPSRDRVVVGGPRARRHVNSRFVELAQPWRPGRSAPSRAWAPAAVARGDGEGGDVGQRRAAMLQGGVQDWPGQGQVGGRWWRAGRVMRKKGRGKAGIEPSVMEVIG